MKRETMIAIFAIFFGFALITLAYWQWTVGTVYLKHGTWDLDRGWPFLVIEVGLGAYIVVKGIRGVLSDSWPPPPIGGEQED